MLVPFFLSLIDCNLPAIDDKIGMIPILMEFSFETSTHTKLSGSYNKLSGKLQLSIIINLKYNTTNYILYMSLNL